MTVHKCDRCGSEGPVFKITLNGVQVDAPIWAQHTPDTVFEICKTCQSDAMVWLHGGRK